MDGFWNHEDITDGMISSMEVRQMLYSGRTKFQSVHICDLVPAGKTYFLDGKMQSSQLDEFVYHESLVHPVMLAHPNPKSVFIGGGGEFATAREVLRHKSVEHVVMVDIDEAACDVCREHLPEWGAGANADPRLEVHYEDAYGWLETSGQKFDVIIMDINDPQEAGPGMRLYYKAFYEMMVSKCLNPGGLFVTQSGAGNISTDTFAVIHSTLKSVFEHVVPYTTCVVTFGSEWAWNIAFNGDAAIASTGPGGALAVRDQPMAELDDAIAERITGELKFLDGLSYRGIMGVGKHIRKILDAETRVMTKETPVFLYAKAPDPR
jgi:thermospermine synthase